MKSKYCYKTNMQPIKIWANKLIRGNSTIEFEVEFNVFDII